jgi:nitrogen regulatory protein PII
MLKMAMVVYNEAIDDEVSEMLEECGMKNYTKITAAFGKGATSGTHLGNDIWPGRNNILYIVCEEKQAKQLLSCVTELRKQLGREGIKAFILPVEELT